MESPWILVLCHEFPPLGGGAGKNLFLLCRELTRLGLKVKVWTVDPGEKKRRSFDYEVQYFGIGRRARFETSLTGMALYIARTLFHARTIRYGRPTVILSVLGIPAGLAGSLIAALTHRPHLVWYHGSDIHAGRKQGPGFLQKFLLHRIWSGAAVNFFISQDLRALAQNFGSPKCPLILPSCPSPEILANPITKGADGKAPYFLFLGRFDPVKNPLLPLLAMLKLKSKAKVTLKLRMVGSGILREAVHEYVRKQSLSDMVTVDEAADFNQVPDLLRSAYALILPSHMEGFNTTLLEAAHFGVPAIAADTFGIREFVVAGETGLLFEENNAQALAEAMEKLAADPSLRDALGQGAKTAALPYRPEMVAQTFLHGLAEVPGLASLFRLQGV